jgi:hypothetical protein
VGTGAGPSPPPPHAASASTVLPMSSARAKFSCMRSGEFLAMTVSPFEVYWPAHPKHHCQQLHV